MGCSEYSHRALRVLTWGALSTHMARVTQRHSLGLPLPISPSRGATRTLRRLYTGCAGYISVALPIYRFRAHTRIGCSSQSTRPRIRCAASEARRRTHARARTHASKHTHARTRRHARAYTHTHMRMHAHKHTHTRAHTQADSRMHARMHAHTHAHAHRHARARARRGFIRGRTRLPRRPLGQPKCLAAPARAAAARGGAPSIGASIALHVMRGPLGAPHAGTGGGALPSIHRRPLSE